MTNIIENNAYRLLGLNITASEKEILKRQKEIINRLKINDSPEYEFDFNIPKNYRTESSVEEAFQKLQSQKEKPLQYFFSFDINDKKDEKAHTLIKKEKIQEAIDTWTKAAEGKNSTSLHYKKNLAILYCILLSQKPKQEYLKKSISIWNELIRADNLMPYLKKRYEADVDGILYSEEQKFKETMLKSLADIYTDISQKTKNPDYIKTFQEKFNTYGEKTEKTVLSPIYESINKKINKLNSIKIDENFEEEYKNPSKKRDDKCDNCGNTDSETFWDYEDGSVLCDECENRMSKKWHRRVEEKLEELDEQWGHHKWGQVVERINKIVKSINKDLKELENNGLYDSPKSKIIRDNIASAIKEKAVGLHNYGDLLKESEKLMKIATKISGTDTHKSQIKKMKTAITQNINKQDESQLTVEFSGFLFSKKRLEFMPKYIVYGDSKIKYKDILEVSFHGVRQDFSSTYYFTVSSSNDYIKISLSNEEKWQQIIAAATNVIFPEIIDRKVKKIFKEGKVIEIGKILFDKDGYTRNKFFGGQETVSWDGPIYEPRFDQGQLILFKDDNGRIRSFAGLPMESPNVVVIPYLIVACIEAYQLYKVRGKKR